MKARLRATKLWPLALSQKSELFKKSRPPQWAYGPSPNGPIALAPMGLEPERQCALGPRIPGPLCLERQWAQGFSPNGPTALAPMGLGPEHQWAQP